MPLHFRAVVVAFLIGTAISSIRAQAPDRLAFEVASVKQATFPNDDYFRGFAALGACGAGFMRITGNRVAFERVTPCSLMRLAYDVHDYQIVGAPAWMAKADKTTFFAIDARAAQATTLTQDRAREMLKTLLADRFQLRVHHEMRNAPVYALVVGKGGPKFPQNGEKFVDSGGKKLCTDSTGSGGSAGPRPTRWSCGGVSGAMTSLAMALSTQTDRAVVDRTGISAPHAYMLQWTPDGITPQPDGPPTLFTAIQDQLGLKLEPRTEPVDALVIDHVDRPAED